MILPIYRPFQGLCTTVTLGFLLGQAVPAPAQEAGIPSVVHPAQAPDSVDLHRRARKAQRDFESLHRRLLPMGEGRSGGSCDEYVGRLCLFDDDLWWEPPLEDSVLTFARDVLLESLAEIGRAIPGDRWVLAQRVRYLGDMGRWDAAKRLAAGCPSHLGWWCQGLGGYVLHRSGDVTGALEAFSLALESMGPERAGDWMDPHPIMEYAGGRWLRETSDLTREEARARFWTLADPLFLTPGNERLSEHLARRFGFTLYDDSALTMGMPWGRAFEQLLLRYGFIAGWEQIPEGIGAREIRNVVEHHHPESRGLLPPFQALEDPAGLPEGIWVPRDRHPRSASAPVLAALIAEGEAQTAVFRRDGGLLVVAAYDLPRDTFFLRRRSSPGPSRDESGSGGRIQGLPRRPRWEPPPDGRFPDTLAGLFLLEDSGSRARLETVQTGARGVLRLAAPTGGYLLSLELWCPQGRWGARVRHGVRGLFIPPDVPHLSDLLLLDPGPSPPDSLPDGLSRALPSPSVPSGGSVAVAWEVYGLGRRGEPITFGLSLVDEGASFVRRALNRIGLFRKDPVLTLSWTEEGPDRAGPFFRSVDVDLPRMDPGEYLLRLEMDTPYRSRVASSRRIEVF